MFKIGDTAVYPAHGVGIIESIEKKAIGDVVHNFFMLRILENDYMIMVPTANAERVGLRPVAGKKAVRQIWKILKDTKVTIDFQTWNRRQREYTEKIKTGCVVQLATVLRDLYVLSGNKELSYGERKMLEQARNLLVGEIAASTDETSEKVISKIEAIYH
jgi:CarD family transcriptional regulator, regulator of rRNA transcription